MLINGDKEEKQKQIMDTQTQACIHNTHKIDYNINEVLFINLVSVLKPIAIENFVFL